MTIAVAHSTKTNASEAVLDLRQQLAGFDPRFLMFFVSPNHDPEAVSAALQRSFDCPSIGSTTAGEFAGGRILEGSIVMMGFDAAHVEAAAVALVHQPDSEQSVREAYAALLDRTRIDENSDRQVVGLVLQDGLSGAEEALMAALSNLSNIPFVGGSAADGGRFQRTHVFVNGQLHSSAAALALLKLRQPFQILKTQSFDIGAQTLSVTRADEATRRVLEFNGKPASEEYARALGVPTDQLAEHFQLHPLGLLVDRGQPFVRSPRQVQGTDVVFYCNVKEGMDLRLLEARNIVEDTRADLELALASFGPISGLLNFHCILRTLELKHKGQSEAYAELFDPATSIGFSTYGESYIGHINHTSVILLFA
jgi:hypothetical protein